MPEVKIEKGSPGSYLVVVDGKLVARILNVGWHRPFWSLFAVDKSFDLTLSSFKEAKAKAREIYEKE